MKENRRVSRITINLTAAFNDPASEDEVSVATVFDLSAIGFGIIAKQPLSMGAELPVEILLPDGDKIKILSKVIYVNVDEELEYPEFKIGFKIIEPVNDETRKLIQFYARNISQNTKIKKK